jgi:hypothetical protein
MSVILSVDELYRHLNSELEKSTDGDLEVLTVLKNHLLKIDSNDKISVANALKDLNKLADARLVANGSDVADV